VSWPISLQHLVFLRLALSVPSGELSAGELLGSPSSARFASASAEFLSFIQVLDGQLAGAARCADGVRWFFEELCARGVAIPCGRSVRQRGMA